MTTAVNETMEVVIIDDNEVNVTLMRHLTARLPGCVPICFTSPVEALAWCGQRLPDLVIVDYMMPDINGTELIRRFRAMEGRGDIPILMVTASDAREVRYQSLEAGANDFLTKPVDQTEFRARAGNMLALRISQRRLQDRAQWLAAEVRKATAEIVAREREIVVRLAKAAEFRDPETGAHILRVAHYCQHIASQLGLGETAQDLLLEASPMHDVGKVGIPDNILLKTGPLDKAEFELMKQHARLGHEILTGSNVRVLQVAAIIALSHHERYDGSGYPDGRAGEDIPLYGRIVAVADVFDALTSERPYKKAWEIEQAIAYLRSNVGSHFDPSCVEAFLKNWEQALAIRDRFKDAAQDTLPPVVDPERDR